MSREPTAAEWEDSAVEFAIIAFCLLCVAVVIESAELWGAATLAVIGAGWCLRCAAKQ